MIFLTIGTHEPFDRLVRAVDDWAGRTGAELFGQIVDPGEKGYRPRNFAWAPRLSPGDYREACRRSDFMVSHAGMGSIISALTFSKPIVVMPRRGHFNETRNDHQFATVSKLGSKPGVVVALDEITLPATLDRVLAEKGAVKTETISPFADDGLTKALRELIHSA